MNKYIKKCLLVYVSMAVILCGMVGVTYAITATDADQYVTRSQYAVDMAHLQNKLDEAEAGLMGSINRYRSTDIKFVTYDSPNKYQQDSRFSAGYHNGGNLFPRRQRLNGTLYMFSPRVNSLESVKDSGGNIIYYLWRLYNGNYIFNRAMAMKSGNSSNPKDYVPVVTYAIPVENFPGWYIINRIVYGYGSGHRSLSSLVKLDPNSPHPASQLYGATLRIRYKKSLFTAGTYDSSQPLTGTITGTTNYWQGVAYYGPFSPIADTAATNTGSDTITVSNLKDPDTGDWITTVTGMLPWGQGYAMREYYITMDQYPPRRIIPADNVEYVIGSLLGCMEVSGFTPDPNVLGYGTGDDRFWKYEFVDCENGIKYWHAWRSPDHTPEFNQNPQTWHYCLPIVY